MKTLNDLALFILRGFVGNHYTVSAIFSALIFAFRIAILLTTCAANP